MKNIFFILIAFILTGATVRAQSLKGTAWLLKSVDNIEEGKSQIIEDKVQLSLLFDSDSLYSGYGCNHYSGKYTTANGKNITMQKAEGLHSPTCLGLGNLEKEVLDLYLKATRYKVENGLLFIFTSNDYRLIYKKQ